MYIKVLQLTKYDLWLNFGRFLVDIGHSQRYLVILSSMGMCDDSEEVSLVRNKHWVFLHDNHNKTHLKPWIRMNLQLFPEPERTNIVLDLTEPYSNVINGTLLKLKQYICIWKWNYVYGNQFAVSNIHMCTHALLGIRRLSLHSQYWCSNPSFSFSVQVIMNVEAFIRQRLNVDWFLLKARFLFISNDFSRRHHTSNHHSQLKRGLFTDSVLHTSSTKVDK
jgi:hypothetical protein